MEEGKGEGHVREAHLSTVHCGHSATHTHGGERERERQRERERVLYCYDMATYTVCTSVNFLICARTRFTSGITWGYTIISLISFRNLDREGLIIAGMQYFCGM